MYDFYIALDWAQDNMAISKMTHKEAVALNFSAHNNDSISKNDFSILFQGFHFF